MDDNKKKPKLKKHYGPKLRHLKNGSYILPSAKRQWFFQIDIFSKKQKVYKF